jgi:alkylation response protein AidB-like acyl-CoA dehydrogenase
MDFILSTDQEALRDGITSLCHGRFGMDRVREGFDPSVWKELAEAGVFSLPELGFGLAEQAVVFEALGAALIPGPLVWGALANESDRVVTGVENGVVTHLDAADAVYDSDGKEVAIADASPVAHPLDPLTPMHRVSASGAVERGGWYSGGAVLTAAYLVGMATRVSELAVAYAQERQQFDQPIGRFQAVKHLLADNLVRSELARAAVHAAAVEPSDTAASAAKVLAGDAAVANARTAFQVFGGMGFTWEVDVHLYLKRAWLLDRQFGTADSHAHALSQ